MTGRIAVIGSTNVDLFARVPHHPTPGETVLGGSGQRAPGGKGANQALAARLQGADVAFVGAVGSDTAADAALARLRRAGVELSRVKTTPDAPTGLAIITVADGGENTIVVVPGANASVTPADAESAVAALGTEDLVLLQGELPRETTEAAIRRANAGEIRVVLNLAPWGELDLKVLRMVDPLVVNEHEGRAVAAAVGAGTVEDASELAGALVSADIRATVVTIGARGAIVADRTGSQVIQAPIVPAVDTTGAGDAFTGGLVTGLAAGGDLATAASHATRVGAYSVRHSGAQPSYPSSKEKLP